jgi:hypothetical protein
MSTQVKIALTPELGGIYLDFTGITRHLRDDLLAKVPSAAWVHLARAPSLRNHPMLPKFTALYSPGRKVSHYRIQQILVDPAPPRTNPELWQNSWFQRLPTVLQTFFIGSLPFILPMDLEERLLHDPPPHLGRFFRALETALLNSETEADAAPILEAIHRDLMECYQTILADATQSRKEEEELFQHPTGWTAEQVQQEISERNRRFERRLAKRRLLHQRQTIQ